jgi:hypothetical protein
VSLFFDNVCDKSRRAWIKKLDGPAIFDFTIGGRIRLPVQRFNLERFNYSTRYASSNVTQFNSINSDFRQGGWGYTTDAGVHWTFPGVLENNIFRSDPVLNASDTGDFFYLSLWQTFYDDIWRSTDGGQAWTRLTFADVTGGDKQWFTIDTTQGMGMAFCTKPGARATTTGAGDNSAAPPIAGPLG